MKTKFALSVLATFIMVSPGTFAQSSEAQESPSFKTMFEAGFVSAFTCSGVFIAGRTVEQLRGLELTDADGVPSMVGGERPEISIDRDRQVVSVPIADGLPPNRAAFRDGLGCSVLPWGVDASAGASLPQLSKKRPRYDKNDASWPKRDLIKPADGPKPY